MTHKKDEHAAAWFHRKATAYVETQMLYHLNQVGVWAQLQKGPQSPHDIATTLGLVPEVLRVMLEYVEGVDSLLERDDEGRFELTEFGHRVLKRFGRDGLSGSTFNFFDVRVGAYGPVWQQMGKMLTGDVTYGRDLEREGDRAADAVFTIGKRMEKGFVEILKRVQPDIIVELGVTSGLLELGKSQVASVDAIGLDRDQMALDVAAQRFQTETGHEGTWIQTDIFSPESWLQPSFSNKRGLIFSVHFHEFLARGVEHLQRWLRELQQHLPGWSVLAIEQPRLRSDERDKVTEVEWLYNHSNILIHHLIGNGHILSDANWRKLFAEADCELDEIHPMEFLGYNGYTFRF